MSIQAAFAVPHPPLILPEIGRGEERKIQNTIDGFHKVSKQIAELAPETVVVCSPHSILYADYFHLSSGQSYEDNMHRFGADGLGMDVPYDEAFIGALCGIAAKNVFPAGTLGSRDDTPDHATFIPLYFLNQYYRDYKLVRVGLSGLPLGAHIELGKLVAQAAQGTGKKTVLIASGDLSHKLKEDGPYGFAPQGPEFDQKVEEAFASGNLEALAQIDEAIYEPAAECGLRSFVIMAGALSGLAIQPELFSYEGPFGVGYATAAFLPERSK